MIKECYGCSAHIHYQIIHELIEKIYLSVALINPSIAIRYFNLYYKDSINSCIIYHCLLNAEQEIVLKLLIKYNKNTIHVLTWTSYYNGHVYENWVTYPSNIYDSVLLDHDSLYTWCFLQWK